MRDPNRLQPLYNEICRIHKENCPDCRNTKIMDIVNALNDYNLNLTVYDPWANPAVAMREYGIEIINELPKDKFDAIIVGVAHDEFKTLNIKELGKESHVIYDVKWILPKEQTDGRL